VERHRFFSPDGVGVAAYDFGGAGPDLVFAHATGYHGLVWQPVIERLRGEYRCVTFDERGHGDSDKAPADNYDWGALATDLATVVDGFALRRPFGVGHSCGGALLFLVEARAPGTFRSIYAYEPVVVPTEARPLHNAVNPMAEAARRRREVFASRQEAFDNYATKPMYSRCVPEGLRAYVEHGFEDLPDGSVRLKCRGEDEARVFAMGGSSDTWTHLGDVRAPVTLARGSLSGFPFDEPTQAAVAGALPRSRRETLEGLTHLGPLEDPDLLAGQIRRALAGG
jgi:pimeloyl-ACP methyl ester carboxylesterase